MRKSRSTPAIARTRPPPPLRRPLPKRRTPLRPLPSREIKIRNQKRLKTEAFRNRDSKTVKIYVGPKKQPGISERDGKRVRVIKVGFLDCIKRKLNRKKLMKKLAAGAKKKAGAGGLKKWRRQRTKYQWFRFNC